MKKKKLSGLKMFVLILANVLSFAGLIVGICISSLIHVIGFGISFLVWAIYTIALVDFEYFR